MPEPFSPTHKAIIYDALSCTVRFAVALYCRVFELVPHGKWSVVYSPIFFNAASYRFILFRCSPPSIKNQFQFSKIGSVL